MCPVGCRTATQLPSGPTRNLRTSCTHWYCDHSIAVGQDLPVGSIHPGAWEGQGSGGEGTLECCASRDCLNAHTVLFSPRLPLMPPPLLLHSPLRPLLATAGFLQLRLSLCSSGPCLLGPCQGVWAPGCFSLCPLSISTLLLSPGGPQCLPPGKELELGFCLGSGTDCYPSEHSQLPSFPAASPGCWYILRELKICFSSCSSLSAQPAYLIGAPLLA